MGKHSHCPQPLYFIAENVSFLCGFGYQSFSTKCENCFSQISTKVTSDRVQKPQLLCAQDGEEKTVAHKELMNLKISRIKVLSKMSIKVERQHLP